MVWPIYLWKHLWSDMKWPVPPTPSWNLIYATVESVAPRLWLCSRIASCTVYHTLGSGFNFFDFNPFVKNLTALLSYKTSRSKYPTPHQEHHCVPSLWPSGIGSRLGRIKLWVRFLAVSDIYPMFIELTITWVPLRGSLGTYGLTQKLS